jgi:hypothetical protein
MFGIYKLNVVVDDVALHRTSSRVRQVIQSEQFIQFAREMARSHRKIADYFETIIQLLSAPSDELVEDGDAASATLVRNTVRPCARTNIRRSY